MTTFKNCIFLNKIWNNFIHGNHWNLRYLYNYQRKENFEQNFY